MSKIIIGQVPKPQIIVPLNISGDKILSAQFQLNVPPEYECVGINLDAAFLSNGMNAYNLENAKVAWATGSEVDCTTEKHFCDFILQPKDEVSVLNHVYSQVYDVNNHLVSEQFVDNLFIDTTGVVSGDALKTAVQ